MSDQSLSDIWRTCLPWSNSRATWEWRVKAMRPWETNDCSSQCRICNTQKTCLWCWVFHLIINFEMCWALLGRFEIFWGFLFFFLRFVLLTIYFLPHLFWMFWGVLRLLDISHLPRWYCICLMCSTCLFYMLFDCGIFAMHLLKYVILNDCALIVLEDLEDSERVFFVFCMFFFRFLRLCSCLFIFTSLLLIRDLIPI